MEGSLRGALKSQCGVISRLVQGWRNGSQAGYMTYFFSHGDDLANIGLVGK